MFKFTRLVVSVGGTGGMVIRFGMASPSRNDEACVGRCAMFVARVCSHVGIDSMNAISSLMPEAAELLSLSAAAR